MLLLLIIADDLPVHWIPACSLRLTVQPPA
mgnify:CR=1 FL=1